MAIHALKIIHNNNNNLIRNFMKRLQTLLIIFLLVLATGAAFGQSVTITVNPKTRITTEPISPAAVCAGTGSPTLTVAGSGTGTLLYQWYDGATLLTDVAPFSGVTTATLMVTNPPYALNGKVYTVKITSDCGFATSNGAAVLTVYPLPVITITSNQTICEDATPAALTVTLTTGKYATAWGYVYTVTPAATTSPLSPVTVPATNQTSTITFTAGITATTTVTVTQITDGNGCISPP
jgi:hypothetical protein